MRKIRLMGCVLVAASGNGVAQTVTYYPSTTTITADNNYQTGYSIVAQGTYGNVPCPNYDGTDTSVSLGSYSNTEENGSAILVTPPYPFGPGTYTVSGQFSGFSYLDTDTGNECEVTGSSSTQTIVIPQVSPLLAVKPPAGPTPEGSTLTIAVNVNVPQAYAAPEPPTGTVSLYYGSIGLTSVKLGIDSTRQNGTATLTIPTKGVAPGNYTLEAVYSGDANYYPVTGSQFTVTISSPVTATSTMLSSTPTTVILGNPVTFAAQVALETNSIPITGKVTFATDGVTLGATTVQPNGTASLTFDAANIPTGTYPITASYSGDSNYLASVSPSVSVQVIAQGTTTTSLTASPDEPSQGEQTTLYVTVASQQPVGSPVPTGSVTLLYGNATLAMLTLGAGHASLQLSTTGLPIGNYSVSARYNGSPAYAGSSSATQTVTITPGAVVSASASINPVQLGEVTVLSATVKEQTGNLLPTGTVSFAYQGSVLGSATLSSGSATLPVGTGGLPLGTDTITVSYGGDNNFSAASTTLSLAVQ